MTDDLKLQEIDRARRNAEHTQAVINDLKSALRVAKEEHDGAVAALLDTIRRHCGPAPVMPLFENKREQTADEPVTA